MAKVVPFSPDDIFYTSVSGVNVHSLHSVEFEEEKQAAVAVSVDGSLTLSDGSTAKRIQLLMPHVIAGIDNKMSHEVVASEIIQISRRMVFLAIAASSPASTNDFFGVKMNTLVMYDLSNFFERWKVIEEKVELSQCTLFELNSSVSLLKSVALTRLKANESDRDTVLLVFAENRVRSFLCPSGVENPEFFEVITSELLPELTDSKLSGNVLNLDLMYDLSRTYRWLVWGSDLGHVAVTKLDSITNTIVECAESCSDSPIAALKFLEVEENECLLLMGSCLAPSKIYRVDLDMAVYKNNLESQAMFTELAEMRHSGDYDCILSGCVTVLEKGRWVVTLSTFDKKLLIYEIKISGTERDMDDNANIKETNADITSGVNCDLCFIIPFSYPVLASRCLVNKQPDKDSDAMKYSSSDIGSRRLAVLTWSGLHIRSNAL